MRINRIGRTRLVIELDKIVIKMPSPLNGWQNFIRGILGNIVEKNAWRYNSGANETGLSHLLCPVLWSSWGGWILVMIKAEKVLSYEEFWDSDVAAHITHFPGDDSGPNYGLLCGKLVKIDYGNLNEC